MKVLTLVVGSVLYALHGGSIVAAEPSLAASAHATGPAVASNTDRGHTSGYARQRERVRQAGYLRRETSRRLRNEARSHGTVNLHAIDDLIDLYITLRLDLSLTESGRQRLAGKVRSRLLRARERLQKEYPGADAVRDASAAATDSVQAAAINAAPEKAAASEQLARHVVRRTAASAARLSHHVLAQQGLAGPAGAAAAGAFGAQPFPPDYGPELADLIQTVIAPSTWERNGGPGSIYYYRPLRVLVIRQTGEVHGRIGGVIEDLRQAGN